MDAGEYKHVALGLIFLKYISDAFQERYDAIKTRDLDADVGRKIRIRPAEVRDLIVILHKLSANLIHAITPTQS